MIILDTHDEHLLVKLVGIALQLTDRSPTARSIFTEDELEDANDIYGALSDHIIDELGDDALAQEA